MKTTDLSIKELAAYLGVSTDTIRRAVRKGELPATRVGTAYRFDLRQIRAQMERNAVVYLQRRPAACDCRRQPATRTATTPPSGNTGALPTRIVSGGLLAL